MGYMVLRFSNEEINNNLEEVLERIKKELINV
jgi:very-short-patch-repair endonuclease